MSGRARAQRGRGRAAGAHVAADALVVVRPIDVDEVKRVVLERLQVGLRVALDTPHCCVGLDLTGDRSGAPMALADCPRVDIHHDELSGLECADDVLGQCACHCANLDDAGALLGIDMTLERISPLWVQPRPLHD